MTTEEIAGGSASDSAEGSAPREENTEQVNNAEAVAKKNRELLAELKKEREARVESQKQLDAIETQKLADSGQKDELIKKYQDQTKALEEKLKNSTNTFAMKTVKHQLKEAARAMGCEKPELVLKLANLSDISVSTEDFTVDTDSVKTVLEAVRDEAPMLFKKSVAPPRDGTPTTDETKSGYLAELKAAKTQRELDAVRKKYGKTD
jgi:hypothetical protein